MIPLRNHPEGGWSLFRTAHGELTGAAGGMVIDITEGQERKLE